MPLFCNNCGASVDESDRACKACGSAILSVEKLKEGTMLDERYEIRRLIKTGAMGAVYEAMDHRFEKTSCALKEMLNISDKPEDSEYYINRFKKEALILHKLKHPNLPHVIDYFMEKDRYYLVMDYIEGKDLETLLTKDYREGVPEELVIEWSLEILNAMEYLHRQSPPIVYRDLKPANVMLQDPDHNIMLVDFGIARTIMPDDKSLKTCIGTPAFGAMEVFEGKAEPRSDIYSLGATMHCLLTGKIPRGNYIFKSVRKKKPEVSEALDSIIMKALSIGVKDRYGDAGAMREAIERLRKKKADESYQEIKREVKEKKSWLSSVFSWISGIFGKNKTGSEKTIQPVIKDEKDKEEKKSPTPVVELTQPVSLLIQPQAHGEITKPLMPVTRPAEPAGNLTKPVPIAVKSPEPSPSLAQFPFQAENTRPLLNVTPKINIPEETKIISISHKKKHPVQEIPEIPKIIHNPTEKK